MKKVIAFGASNSDTSINQSLAIFAASLLTNQETEVLNINDFYPLPIFKQQDFDANGVPENAQKFFNQLSTADGYIVSFPEHNGSYTAAFKNLYDWASKVNSNVWGDKPLLVMGASPGGRGAATAISQPLGHFPFMGAKITGSFSLPKFYENFDQETGQGITNPEHLEALKKELRTFEQAL